MRCPKRPNRGGIRCRFCGVRTRERVCGERGSLALSPSNIALPRRKTSRSGEGDLSSWETGVWRWRISRSGDWAGVAAIAGIFDRRYMNNSNIVGTSVPRLEGRDKISGRARYVDDMELPGMLYGATVRSRIARGKIKQI